MKPEIAALLAHVTPAKRVRDAEVLLRLMSEVTGEDPVVNGSIIGFGTYHYRYASGREGNAPAAGFAPRKAATTIYLMDGLDAAEDLLGDLGPHRTGVGCLYITDLGKVDLDILRLIIKRSYETLTAGTYGLRARESHRTEH